MEKLSKEIKENIIKTLDKSSARFAVLFGSAASGRMVKTSDIDIAVFLDPAKNKSERFDEQCEISGRLDGVGGRKIDVVCLNDVRSIPLKFSIIKEGDLLLERDEKSRLDFEFRTMTDYYNFSAFISEYNRAYVQRILQ